MISNARVHAPGKASGQNAPSGMQIYCPSFRGKSITDISKEIDFNANWLPYGYTKAVLLRDIATVIITR